jgi:hypothetical protein
MSLLQSLGYGPEADAYKPIPQHFRDYAYGPELIVNGAMVDGTRMDLAKTRNANYIDLTPTPEAGSCPHLLSWDENDNEWVNLGKVLHKAPSRDRVYTDALTFEGLRTRFRIEEREPEVSHLLSAKLVAKLESGESIELAPVEGGFRAGNSGDRELLWGESADISFALPDNVDQDRVVESKFEITGYYERYSDIAAQTESNR